MRSEIRGRDDGDPTRRADLEGVCARRLAATGESCLRNFVTPKGPPVRSLAVRKSITQTGIRTAQQSAIPRERTGNREAIGTHVASAMTAPQISRIGVARYLPPATTGVLNIAGPTPLTHTDTTSTRTENDNEVITKTRRRRRRSTAAMPRTASNSTSPKGARTSSVTTRRSL